ncbi:Formamidopyrimidine-DNA glycosylase N-terminal domain [Balamuthia mandrillaris]
MPELPEIHRYSQDINQWCKGKRFRLDGGGYFAKKSPDVLPWFDNAGLKGRDLLVESKARGKELQLCFTAADDPTKTAYVVFKHGLVGGWRWAKPGEVVPYVLFSIETTQKERLCMVDHGNMGSWYWGYWAAKRGPDPLTDWKAFRQNVKANSNAKVFQKNICDVMLEQEFFNGVGNYLRAEILYRAKVDPFQSAASMFNGGSGTFQYQGMSYDKGDLLLALCHIVPKEVLDKGLNKYGNAQEKDAFDDWLKCYGKSQCQKEKGRTVWFVPNNHHTDPSEEDKQSFVALLSSPNSSFPSNPVSSSITLLPSSLASATNNVALLPQQLLLQHPSIQPQKPQLLSQQKQLPPLQQQPKKMTSSRERFSSFCDSIQDDMINAMSTRERGTGI